MTSTLLLSSCLLLVFSHVTSHAYAFTLDNTKPSDTDFYPSVADDPESYRWEGSISPDLIQKRAPSVSINQDLVSLANLLRNEAGRRRFKAASSSLTKLGKRSQPEMFEYLQGIPSPLMSLGMNDGKRMDSPGVFHRSTRRISVNVPLDALSQMMRTERRRKSDARLANVHNKFIEIGKRSVDMDE